MDHGSGGTIGPMTYDAVVLAGGQARRLGGLDKPMLVVNGRSLLDTVLLACSSARQTVVVGPERPVGRPVLWAREQQVGGGPAAALAAGLQQVTADVVVLLAADLPYLDARTVEQLVAAVDGDGALLTDTAGRDQLLCSAWRTTALRRSMPPDPDGASIRSVLGPLAAVRVAAAQMPGAGWPWTDCDTPEDLARARGTR